ncbi:MAG: tRNA (adenosine(37)-N6)-dimethylallyltransferase MiaA [Clostridiales bacterium]|nr:tRNA (adenosine(37)-N6)-dimethylallyltransferase MiaA [Clostridiales bacterium]
MATLYAVVGPTATGKSDFAVELALLLDGEVISGDSMQIYRGMDIGTAKATARERRGVPHHLLDLREPGESFSAAEYQSLARGAVREVAGRGRTPVLAGGSGLYIDSVLYNYEYEREAAPGSPLQGYREALAAEAEDSGPHLLWEKLRRVDPESAGRLHPNDTKRVIRALEYAAVHGKPISGNKAAFKAPSSVFPTVLLGLNLPRQLLYGRIDKRVDGMMENGLLEEVAALWEGGALKGESQAGQAIGYKQLIAHLEGGLPLEEAVADIKRESRRYAKRQLTWFRRNPDIHWLDARKVWDGSGVGDWAVALDLRADSEGFGWLEGQLREMGLSYREQ